MSRRQSSSVYYWLEKIGWLNQESGEILRSSLVVDSYGLVNIPMISLALDSIQWVWAREKYTYGSFTGSSFIQSYASNVL